MTYKEMMQHLESEQIHTWFDLGLFLDRIRENRDLNRFDVPKSYDDYIQLLRGNAMAFVSFYIANDGVSVEVSKYAKSLAKIMPDIPMHFVCGDIDELGESLLPEDAVKHEIPLINGFDNWSLYKDFFFVKMNRGSRAYNDLIVKFWKETLEICKQLGGYISDNNIKLLYSINVHSNPGNLSLALAEVLISEYMNIPVINNAHDYYWDGGHKAIDIKEKGIAPGPRDFFFLNSHIGEVFSIIELIMPWESRSWVTININKRQSKHIVEENGHNPANVMEISTAINTDEFTPFTKRHGINTKIKLKDILSNYRDTCYAYSASDFVEKQILNPFELDFDPFVLGHRWTDNYDFVNNNIILLQPTRIVKRKRIEFNLKIIEKLFQRNEFVEKFEENPDLTITLLVTSHIPSGQYKYFLKLVRSFAFFLETLPSQQADRIYMAFLFSEFDKERFKQRYEYSITIPDLYNIANVIVLPSETEGRGLPILEACSTGVPLVCNVFEPQEVYFDVIGENLSDSEKLKILSFSDYFVSDQLIKEIYQYIFYPQTREEVLKNNRKVISNRFSYEALRENLNQILKRLHFQMQSNAKNMEYAAKHLNSYFDSCFKKPLEAKDLIHDQNRHYLPGYGRLSFMHMLKALIDPSFFRVEEQLTKGLLFRFTQNFLDDYKDHAELKESDIISFYNIIHSLFLYEDGNHKIRHDHAFNYRYRNTKKYPYQQFTVQELTGIVYRVFKEKINLEKPSFFNHSPHFFVDWRMAYVQLANSEHLGIDDRDILISYIKKGLPFAFFPGQYLMYELEFFVLQPIRAQLGLKIEEELTENLLTQNLDKISKISIFINAFRPSHYFTKKNLEDFLEITTDYELRLLYKHHVFEVVATEQECTGIHIYQMGKSALKKLESIRKSGGFMIAMGEDAAMMTDIINMERFHLGKAKNEFSANVLGISLGDGFVQYIPPGVRTTLAYPAPLQTSNDFSKMLKRSDFLKPESRLGRETLLKKITLDAEVNGTPIRNLLAQINQEDNPNAKQEPYTFVSGKYSDGLPWNGVMAKINFRKEQKWKFVAAIAEGSPKPVTDIIKDYTSQNNVKIDLAWNGGYILNPELVGKLGLSENYIGSPLGLLIMNGKLVSAPLFNKPAMLFYKDGNIDIKRVNAKNGFTISKGEDKILFSAETYNQHFASKACYYDLLLANEMVMGDGNVIVRLAGNTIKEVIPTKEGQKVKIIPVGLTLSIPKDLYPESWTVNSDVSICMNNSPEFQWDQLDFAIEAGPMLIDQAKGILNMEEEGWKTDFSIRTQAARLDFTDMRGPKIAVGINDEGDLMVLVVNGRIRESVGATHNDMMDILLQYGAHKAMGFDPGGSATLVVGGKAVNVSPYNIDYEKNNYALKGQPRFVANAIMGYKTR